MCQDSYNVGHFRWALEDVHDATLGSLMALSVAVGWSHRAEDWSLLREVGEGRVAIDETGRVHGVAMWFPFGKKFATVGMVITSPRLQKHGGAHWLMKHLINQNKGRNLGLHATNQSHNLFTSLKFVSEGVVFQYEGVAGSSSRTIMGANDGELREFSIEDLGSAEALDRSATGVDRRALLQALVSRSQGVVLSRAGNVEAVAFVRPFGRGMVVGPVIARNETDAVHVVQSLIAKMNGDFLRIDIPEGAKRLTKLAELGNLQCVQMVTRMSYGHSWPYSATGSHAVWALATHATG